jgi:hypothetical protein
MAGACELIAASLTARLDFSFNECGEQIVTETRRISQQL